MNSCKSCEKRNIEVVYDAGQQPVSSRYLKSRNEKEELYSLRLGQCLCCGLVQLMDLVPILELQRVYEWITYNEPEGHLDDVVKQISQLEGINKESSILGISDKDDSTLARFAALGFSKIKRLSIPIKKTERDINVAGIEVIQDYLSSRAFLDKSDHSQYDIIVIRHILEHTYNSNSFLEALRKMTHKNSYLVFEVPDCSLLFSSDDYTAIWEDHTLYFIPETFKAFLQNAGFSIINYHFYPYPYEGGLVIVASLKDEVSEVKVYENVDASRKIMLSYGRNFEKHKKIVREKLQKSIENFGDIAMFGAGHLATMYVNVFNVADLISFVVDDDQNKRGLFVPGCRLPIYSSSALLDKDIKYCLTGLSPESEKKVILENQEFLSNGGIFASIFPNSPMSFLNLDEN